MAIALLSWCISGTDFSTGVQDLDRRVQALRAAIDALPRSHHDCLEFLIFHLARVVENESDNLVSFFGFPFRACGHALDISLVELFR